MKNSLHFLLCLLTPSFCLSQPEDITPGMKGFFGFEYICFSLYGASLDPATQTIDATCLESDITVQVLSAQNQWNLSLTQSRRKVAANCMFSNVDKVFSKHPTALHYNVWIVFFDAERDRYGNELRQVKRIVAYFKLSRDTFVRINWGYVRSEAFHNGFNYSTEPILRMLDSFWYDPNYF